MNAIPVTLMVGLAVLVLYVLYTSRRYRANAIRGLAVRFRMHYLGNALPKSLQLSGTPFQTVSRVWNVIDGEPRGTRIIAFDCQVGMGRRSWRRTVIAVEGGDRVLRDLPPYRDMKEELSSGWRLLYHPKAPLNFSAGGLTSVDELEAILNAVVTDSERAIS